MIDSWEKIDDFTYLLLVPGGWLYRFHYNGKVKLKSFRRSSAANGDAMAVMIPSPECDQADTAQKEIISSKDVTTR